MKRRGLFTVAAIALAIAMILSACSKPADGAGDPAEGEAPASQPENAAAAADNIVKRYKLTGAGDFSDGLAWIWFEKTDGSRELGCIDTSGEVCFTLDDFDAGKVSQYDKFSGGYAHLRVSGKSSV